MENSRDLPVFVHCAANKRVSAFFWLYTTTFWGASEQQATAAMQQIWQPDATWQSFLKNEHLRFQQEGGNRQRRGQNVLRSSSRSPRERTL